MKEIAVEKGKIDFSDEKFTRRRRVRSVKDKAATAGIALGGVSVIIAILLIFIYLMAEVLPTMAGPWRTTETESGSHLAPGNFKS